MSLHYLIADPLDPRTVPIERRTPRLAHLRHAAASRHSRLGANELPDRQPRIAARVWDGGRASGMGFAFRGWIFTSAATLL